MDTTIERGRFPPTNWRRVRDYQDGSPTLAQAALSEFCATYWYPLYAYARRRGKSQDDARDITQGFFEQLISKRFLHEVDAHKGKLRTFLLVALKHYMAKLWRRDHAEMRHPCHGLLSIDELAAEQRYRWEPVDRLTPELVYERQWATTLLKRAGDKVRDEYLARGKADLYQALSGFLSLRKPDQPYAEIAQRFGMTKNAVAVTAHRIRERFRELLRDEVAETVGSWEDVDEELEHFLQVLG